MNIDSLWHLASLTRSELALAKCRAAGTTAEKHIQSAAENVEALLEGLALLRASNPGSGGGTVPAGQRGFVSGENGSKT